MPVKVLFLCVGNCCRSPLGEAIARHVAPDVIEPSSGGLYPNGFIAPSVMTVLGERGISSDGLASKRLRQVDLRAAELVVNMTGVVELFEDPTLPVETWDVFDPYGCDLDTYRRVRDDIEGRVVGLAARLHKMLAV